MSKPYFFEGPKWPCRGWVVGLHSINEVLIWYLYFYTCLICCRVISQRTGAGDKRHPVCTQGTLSHSSDFYILVSVVEFSA